MSNITLYHSVPSRSMTVRWLLEELGEPYQIKMLDMAKQEHKAPEYLALNRMGRVPTLVHDDIVVTETAAICAYIADAFPEAKLAPPVDSPQRAAYYRWLFFAPVSAEPSILWASLGTVTTERDYRPFGELEEVAETLRDAIGNKPFMVGDSFTAADIMIGATIYWGTRLFPFLPKHPELIDYWQRLEARPAWQRASQADQQLMAQ